MNTYQSKTQLWTNATMPTILAFISQNNEGRVLKYINSKLQPYLFQKKTLPNLYISHDPIPDSWDDEHEGLKGAILDLDLPKDAICICKDADDRLLLILTSTFENIIISDLHASGTSKVVVSSVSDKLCQLLTPLVKGAMSDNSLNFIIGNFADELPVTVRLKNLIEFYNEESI